MCELNSNICSIYMDKFVIFSTASAFMDAFAAYWCYQKKIWRALGSLSTFLVASIVVLNIATIGSVLLVLKYQDQESISNHWTAVCVIGPALLYFFFSLSTVSHAILVAVLFLLKRGHGSSFSNRQVIVIMASLALVSCLLLLAPTVWVALKNKTPVITTIQCMDSGIELNMASGTDVLTRKRYVRSLILIYNSVPILVMVFFVSLRTVFYILPAKNLLSRVRSTLIAVVIMFMLLSLSVAFSGMNNLWALDVFGLKRDISSHIFVCPEMSFYTVLLPLCLIFVIPPETWPKVNESERIGTGKLVDI